MRKLIKLALIALGIRAFLRWRKSRQESQAAAPAAAAADPADELRRKLADSRDDVASDQVEEPPAASVTDRRAEVHEQGRAAVDEMNSTEG